MDRHTDRFQSSPVIIMGMHRSGTALVTSILDQFGLFTGKKKDENREALFFQRLNEWALIQSGGAWDNPETFRYILESGELTGLVVSFFRESCETARAASYWGNSHLLSGGKFKKTDCPWGWKDPRNTFTLPVWREIFPEAKIIHVYRHGVDVAASLTARVNKSLSSAPMRLRWDDFLKKRLYRRTSTALSARCYTLEGSFSLWETYMKEAEKHVKTMKNQILEIRYESFLSEPEKHMERLVDFCDLHATDTLIKDAIKSIRPNRAFAYMNDPALREFSQGVEKRLAIYGYRYLLR